MIFPLPLSQHSLFDHYHVAVPRAATDLILLRTFLTRKFGVTTEQLTYSWQTEVFRRRLAKWLCEKLNLWLKVITISLPICSSRFYIFLP